MPSELLTWMHRYPGGLKALAARVGVTRETLYRVAAGWHQQEPTELLREIHEALLQQQHVPTLHELTAAWRNAHHEEQGNG